MAEILRPIYVEKEEGVGSVLSRIQNASEKNLALIFPPESIIFSNVLEVEFLQKELSKLGKEVVIITSDPAQAELAKGLGFKSSSDIKKSEETNAFLQDFYGDKDKKVISPLIKPKMSDIVAKKSEEADSVKIKLTSFPEPEVKREKIGLVKTNEDIENKIEEEKIIAVPRVEAISLTDEDMKVEEAERPKKAKTHLKFPRLSFGKFGKTLMVSPLKKIFIILLLAAVGVFVLTATFIFPKADITVKPAREKAQLNIDVVLNSNVKTVDFEKNILPSQIFKITKTASQEFPATKQEDIKKKAEGMLTIYNGYSSEIQTLVKTTRFMASDGKIFRLSQTVTVPGAKIQGGSVVASSIEAGVIADEAGESYNIGPADFTIPGFKGTDKYKGFYGKSTKPMIGGLIKKGLVVGTEDVKLAEDSLKAKLLEEAKAELEKQLGSDFKLVVESVKAEISESNSVPKIGDPAEKFVLNLKALAQGFAYKIKDLNDLIEEKIALKISDKRLTLPKTQEIAFIDQNLNFTSGEGDFNLLVTEDISWKISEDRLKEILAGKNEAEAKEAIKLFTEIESAKVSLWPIWLKHIPKDSRKIRITLDYE